MSKSRCFQSKFLPLPSRTHHRATHTIKIQAWTSREWRTVATPSVCWDPCEKRAIVYERVEQFIPYMRAPASTRALASARLDCQLDGSRLSVQQGYYIAFANARFMYYWHRSFRRFSRTLKRAPRARVCNSLKLGLSVMNEVIKYHTAHMMLPRIHL